MKDKDRKLVTDPDELKRKKKGTMVPPNEDSAFLHKDDDGVYRGNVNDGGGKA